jgi:ubiquinone/menaquinone biosynthesis C-methylase UbiE
MIIGKTRFYTVWKGSISKGIKKRRLKQMLDALEIKGDKKLKILEIGCANGKDAIQFLDDSSKYELYGIDIVDGQIKQDNFTFVHCDAERIPYDDKFFDVVLSIGTLEHIESMDKLCRVIKEIARIAKSYVMVVPSVRTLVEPHTVGLLWPLRLHKKMIHKYTSIKLKLNFFSEHTWSKFEGFHDADIKRSWYIFPFILNTMIYKKYSD